MNIFSSYFASVCSAICDFLQAALVKIIGSKQAGNGARQTGFDLLGGDADT